MESIRLVLKTGHRGEDVRVLQELLNITPVDGIFGKITRNAVVKYQKMQGLVPDGIVGPMTWSSLKFNPQEIFADTDTLTSATWIENYHLPEGEYVKQETSKKYIFLHHTAGRHNPFKCIDHWARDTRGRIGTHYVIGGISTTLDADNLSREEARFDGRVLRAIDDKYWGYHLGSTGSSYMHRHSISIEICSAGILSKKGDKYYTWFNEEVHPSQVAILEEPFRGSRYFHKYSKKQLKSLEALLYHLSDKHDIDLKSGLQKMDPKTRYEFNSNAWNGSINGILSHTNVRKGKSDVFPQKELNDLIDSLT